ncbi:MAG: hypothetical protein A3F72_10225 [Bacteroidetes bacterium RIFCSPLOWO2_12_FULL_35_15]|nr:MAG: hypothetical protein A3F72_10225 [Bacteroidetes bacterium RIFCSPLOWO2_12_FULL_35_15]
MYSWNQAPLIRLIVPFLLGIIFAVYFPVQFEMGIYIIGSLSFIILCIILIPKLNFPYRNSLWFGLLINIILFLSAYQLTIFKTEKFSNNYFSNFTDSTEFVFARLNEPYIEKNKSLKVVLEILAVKQGEKWERSCGKAMVYFKKDSHSLHLSYGDELVLKTDFNEIPLPQNPGEFNYKRFLAFHNVFHQAYIKNGEWVASGHNSGNIILKNSIYLRDILLNVFITNHIQKDEFAVGAALLLGYVDKLDADIIASYSSTGALHVLSVSGLHVAIVYIVFNWLLFFLDKIKYGKIIKAITLLLLLWFYAALTGLSPSVLRSAAMFSFIIFAKTFNRHTNIYNTLAASAFFLLIINPYLIMDVGFQLSYLAVIGIVYIQPKIYAWFEVENWLLDQIWTITSVSISAQIATFPLGLHYFHQFPNYFLLSNFIVIPVSTVIIYLGLSIFAFAKIAMLVKYLAIAFSWAVWILNSSVELIEKWPYALLKDISISVFETWLMYGLIILFLYYFTKRQYNYILVALCFAIIILFSQIAEQHEQFSQKKIIIYNIPKTSAIDFISSKNNVFLTDSVFAKNEKGLLFRVRHNWWDLGLTNSTIISKEIKTNILTIKDQFIQFFDKRMAIVNSQQVIKNYSFSSLQTINVDYLIVSMNPQLKMEDILKVYHAGKIIFDSSNAPYRVRKWKEECEKLKLNYYSVMDSGAFVIDI